VGVQEQLRRPGAFATSFLGVSEKQQRGGMVSSRGSCRDGSSSGVACNALQL
jgi:hypothetical protein